MTALASLLKSRAIPFPQETGNRKQGGDVCLKGLWCPDLCQCETGVDSPQQRVCGARSVDMPGVLSRGTRDATAGSFCVMGGSYTPSVMKCPRVSLNVAESPLERRSKLYIQEKEDLGLARSLSG